MHVHKETAKDQVLPSALKSELNYMYTETGLTFSSQLK